MCADSHVSLLRVSLFFQRHARIAHAYASALRSSQRRILDRRSSGLSGKQKAKRYAPTRRGRRLTRVPFTRVPGKYRSYYLEEKEEWKKRWAGMGGEGEAKRAPNLTFYLSSLRLRAFSIAIAIQVHLRSGRYLRSRAWSTIEHVVHNQFKFDPYIYI